jgi:hypothetical protein
MKSSMLTERIQLWRRELIETDEGDLSEKWSHSTTVWADVRLKGVEGDALIFDIRIRPTNYRFQRIYWQGLWADCRKTMLKDRESLRFFAKTCPDLTGS